ncbi:hypothetical protein JCM10207_001446 [Rhodosporidiobolus poonsookiae]
MTPTSPPLTSSTTAHPRPPARNKSSSALSTHTIRSLSSTTSAGKPRRNKSSTSLAHGSHHHSAGHHPVSFAHHRKNSHGAGGPSHALKRSGSVSGSARKPTFGLGMTSMTSPGADENHDHDHDGEDGHDERPQRPRLDTRRSSSSSTATVVASERSRGRSESRGRERSRSRAREEEVAVISQTPAEYDHDDGEEEEAEQAPRRTPKKNRDGVSGSVTSTSDWESATDSPLAIGKKLPDVERVQPPGPSALAQAFGDRNGEEGERPVNGTGAGKKAKFQLGASEEHAPEEEEEADEEEAEEELPAIPPAAMPPAETPILPAMPAMVEAITPATTPGEKGDKAAEEDELKPSAEAEAEAAATALPANTTPVQHLSPPDVSPGTTGLQEPSLASAAQPELAYPNKPASQPPSRERSPGTAQVPPLQPQQKEPTPSPAPAPTDPAQPAAPPSSQASPIRPQPQRVHPVRKSSNASIASHASVRSYLNRPAPQFRRTASGATPTLAVDRAATARAELASPRPDDEHDAALRRGVVGERTPPTQGSHARAGSMGSMRSLRQAAEATTAPGRRANTLGPADARRLRPTETAGGALAALGNIAALSSARGSPAPSAGSSDGGALTHAKRSASGYFNAAFRGLAGLPTALSSTPPLSPSANANQRYPIPGAGANSHDRAGSFPRGGGRARSSPSPQHPPLIVKFAEPPAPVPPPPPPAATSPPASSAAALSTSPAPRLGAQHRTASSASLGGPGLAMSRTQQKALLARDAPASSAPSSSPSPAPVAVAGATQQNGMQKWAFGLVREAERIERQYRAVERWRDPLGESLERVLESSRERRAASRREAGRASEEPGPRAAAPGHGAARGKQRAVAA